MKSAKTTGWAVVLMGALGLLAAGCATSMNSKSEGMLPEGSVGTVKHASVPWRNDFSTTITPATGYWGEWKQNIFCNPGSWVAGYMMRVEPFQGSGGGGNDDTSLNSVQLFCKTKSGANIEWISSHDGLWGRWWPPVYCSGAGNFVNSARVRMEPPQGSGDDGAASDVQLGCSAGGTLVAPGGMTWGDWGPWEFCPAGTAVCGLSIRFENWVRDGDDSAMNGLRLHCCTL